MTNPATTYQPLGNFIQIVDRRNRDLQVTKLLGLSIEKCFIPSIANTIGTDMSTYKIIQPRQFAYGPVTSRNGDKITIALYTGDEPAIISQAYVVFEISGTYDTVETQNFASLQQKREQLLPEYLMMWFRRPEFDRYARYHSHGSAREIFDWDEMCATQIPVPPIAEQRAIVAEYAAVQHRMEVNKRLIAKLEETAQTLYKKMFVDGVDKENLPDGWRMGTLGEVCECFDSKRKPLASYTRCDLEKKYPYYGAACLMDFVDDYLFDGCYILMGEDGTVVKDDNTPILQYVIGKFWVNNHAHVLKGTNGFDENLLYMMLSNTNIAHIVTGGVQAKINQANMMSIEVLIPKPIELNSIKGQLEPLFQNIILLEKEIEKLTELQSLLLARMGR